MQAQTNSNTNPFLTILYSQNKREAFIDAATLLKAKQATPRDLTMQLLQLFECNQHNNPAFVIELYELLTVAKERNLLLAAIKREQKA